MAAPCSSRWRRPGATPSRRRGGGGSRRGRPAACRRAGGELAGRCPGPGFQQRDRHSVRELPPVVMAEAVGGGLDGTGAAGQPRGGTPPCEGSAASRPDSGSSGRRGRRSRRSGGRSGRRRTRRRLPPGGWHEVRARVVREAVRVRVRGREPRELRAGFEQLEGHERLLKVVRLAEPLEGQHTATRRDQERCRARPDDQCLVLRPAGSAEEQHAEHRIPSGVEAVLAVDTAPRRARPRGSRRHPSGRRWPCDRRHGADRGERSLQASAAVQPFFSERLGPALKRRRRRLLVTTKTLENAMAAPAMSGLSRPAAASGRAATL